MNTTRAMQLMICGGLLALSACDAPPTESPEQGKTGTLRLLCPTGITDPVTATAAITVPDSQQAHADAIRHLADFPRPDALYPEQVKILCEQYLKRYPDQTQACQAAMHCFIHAVLLQPERFSGRDFDRACDFCDYPADAAAANSAPLYRIDIELSDYRKTVSEKAEILAKLQEQLNTLPPALLPHALYIAAKHTQGGQRQQYVQHYFSQAATPGSNYHLHMVHLGQLPLRQQLAEVTRAAEAGCREDALLPFIKQLSATPEGAAHLKTHEATQTLALAYQLNESMKGQANPQPIAELLLARPDVQNSAYAQLTLARYMQSEGEQGTNRAIELCRPIATKPGALQSEASLLLAKLLASTPNGQKEASDIYMQLSQSPDQETVINALLELLSLQEATQQLPAAIETAQALLKVTDDTELRATIISRQAQAAEQTGNITMAINLYSQLESAYSATPHVALPACKKLLQLLISRNFPRKQDKQHATYTPSDKWYAWVLGQNFVSAWQRSPESVNSLTPEQRIIFDEILKIVDALSIDYDVQTEERDRQTLPLNG